jgi:hypothetical protein
VLPRPRDEDQDEDQGYVREPDARCAYWFVHNHQDSTSSQLFVSEPFAFSSAQSEAADFDLSRLKYLALDICKSQQSIQAGYHFLRCCEGLSITAALRAALRAAFPWQVAMFYTVLALARDKLMEAQSSEVCFHQLPLVTGATHGLGVLAISVDALAPQLL